MKEVLKWLQGIGAGLAFGLGEKLLELVGLLQPTAAAGTVDFFLQTLAIALLARIAGFLVGKLPKPEPVPQ